MGNRVYTLSFDPVLTQSIRVVGEPGGSAQFTSIRELEVYSD
jgi:hypothetical protein